MQRYHFKIMYKHLSGLANAVNAYRYRVRIPPEDKNL